MPTTGAIPWANDISSTQEGDGSNTGTASPSRTTWIGFIVFGICAVALAIVIVMLFFVICLEPFRDQSLVRALPCHHLFHAECIARWFRKHHDTCPICMARDDSVSGSGSGGSALPEPPPPAFLAF